MVHFDIHRSYRVQQNLARYERLLAIAEWYAARNKYDLAVAWSAIAADQAWNSHPGFFVDQRLERLLARVGMALPSPLSSDPPDRHHWPRRILHVLTEAHAIGGHTRLVWRWIQADGVRQHCVLLTRQRGNLPELLVSAAAVTGGWVQTLDWSRNLPVARAKQLRDLALEFDIVILHIHPFDPVPAIAFASGASPPLILLNHAGFSFWIGRDIADVVACLRPSSRQIAIGRRGIGPDRCVRLAIPVSAPEKEPSRSEARAKLALSNDAVILFTVSSSPSKYVPFEPGWSLVQLITSVAQANKQVQVLAIGPNDEGIWREAREQTGGRVRALGQRPDVGLYERAADIYIDSFPVTSPTSFLEAGSYGLPVISFCPHRARAAVLCADDFFVNDLIVRTDTAESFRAELTRLTEDTAARETLGRTMAKGVMATHGPEAFAKQLLETYSRVALMRQTGRFSVPPGTVGRVGALDNSLVQMQQTANLPRSLWDLTKAHVDAFPPGRRKWLRLKVDLVLSLPLRLIAAGRRRRLEPTGCANLNAP